MVSELKRVIDQVSREKGVDREILIQTLEEAVRAAAKKRLGIEHDLEVNFNDEVGEIEVFEFKDVVDSVTNDSMEISLEEAKSVDPDSAVGDSLGVKMDTDEFGRIAAQSAKQVIMQRLREAERNIVYDDFKDRKGEIIHGIVSRFDKGAIIANLGRAEAELPVKEQIPKESYKQGDRVRAYILDVRQFSRGPQIILSRTHPNFLGALFENEVPEISEGIVSIIQVSREPGSRAKIAVSSRDSDVDPVGACVGMRGSRVQAVVQELRGEKIDIVPWDSDPAKFICNALAPSEIVRVIVDEENRAMEVVVPDDQLSLAIGKRGQNVRLASKLSGWKLDVASETNYNRALKDAYNSLLQLDGVGEATASNLYQEGFRSAEDIAQTEIAELVHIEGIGEEKAKKLIESAEGYVVLKKAEEEAEREREREAKERAAAEEEVEDSVESETEVPETEESKTGEPEIEEPEAEDSETEKPEKEEKGIEDEASEEKNGDG